MLPFLQKRQIRKHTYIFLDLQNNDNRKKNPENNKLATYK